MAREYPEGLKKFYKAVYEVVDDPSMDSIISWGQSNTTFVIWDPKELSDRKTFADFDAGIFSKFFPLLKHYGFKRVRRSGPQLEFGNRKFVRGRPDLLIKMQNKALADTTKRAVAKYAKARELDRLQRLCI